MLTPEQVPPDEMTEIVAGLNGTVDKLYIDGIYVMGERYTLTHHAEGRSLYARKVRQALYLPNFTLFLSLS
jgi:hypothetical protein